MTLVLCDQEIASRDCENGVLGAFWMLYLAQVQAVRPWKVVDGCSKVQLTVLKKKNRLVMKIKL